MLGFSPPCASAVWTRVWAEGVCTWEGMSPASRNRFCLQRAQGLWLGGSRRGAREWPQWASLGRGDPGQRPSTQWLRLCLGAAHFSGPRAYHWGLPCQDPPFKTICGICLAESARPAGLRAGAASPCSPAPRWTHQQRLPGVGGLLPPPALMASDSGSSEFCWENSLFKVFFFSPAWEHWFPGGFILDLVPFVGCLPAIPYGPGLLVETLFNLNLLLLSFQWDLRKHEKWTHAYAAISTKAFLFAFSVSTCLPAKPALRPLKISHTWGHSHHLQPGVMCANSYPLGVAQIAFKLTTCLVTHSTSYNSGLVFLLRSVVAVGHLFLVLGCGHPEVGWPPIHCAWCPYKKRGIWTQMLGEKAAWWQRRKLEGWV